MNSTRRTFLQQLLAAGVGIGLSEAGFARLGDRVQQAIAQPARRKLALLIGINQYSELVADRPPVRGSVLAGCLTDVELQRELLMARFGFLPADIVTLTDQQATRSAIVAAFREHLGQAQADDAVLVHFSGLGSRVKLDADGTLRQTIVPIDATLPSEENPDCTDLFADTLDLLLGAIASDRVIAIFDCGFSSLGTSMQGNLRLRARPNAPVGQISADELALQAALRQQPQRAATILSAAPIDRPVVEQQWNGFSAGLLTYGLTQQLWQATAQTQPLVAQAGTLRQQGDRLRTKLPFAAVAKAGDGAVLGNSVSGNEADGRFRVWLGGLPAAVVEHYAAGSRLEVDGQQAIVRARDGLVATVRWVEPEAAPPAIGAIVQEAVRVLPSDLSLTVALDASLERIERVDATSAFAALPRVAVVAAGEQPADYLFGKLQAPTLTASLDPDAEVAQLKGYGLFEADRSAIASTMIEGEEAVKTAVTRLARPLQTLLAMKLLRLTDNHASSRLNIQADLVEAGTSKPVVISQATRSIASPPTPLAAPVFALSSRIQYRLTNRSDRPVYALLIQLDGSGDAIAELPPTTEAATEGEIAPGTTLTLLPPQTAPGWIETHLIVSTAPFQQAAALAAGGLRPVPKPIDLAQAVLQDLQQASQTDAGAIALDVNHWATFTFAYQLAESAPA